MKTFYIPTSTLNFNNILSSESISPKAFYEKRGFGYTRWTPIPENSYNNAIVLYDNLCFFDRPKSDIEDHPLMVEVQLEESELKQAVGFWFSDHTIYLAPTTTRFLFFSEQDRTVTLSMSENSSETKLIRLYTNRIERIEKPSETYKPIATDEPCELNESEISKDFRNNKMKGLLHGYYIGALLSTDLDSIKFLNTLKEVHNIFAAILSSFDRQPTPYQNERLDELFKFLNRKNADYQQLLKIICDEDKTDKVLNLDFVKPQDFVRKTEYLYRLQQEQQDAEKENPAIEWIKVRIKDAKSNIKNNTQLLNPDKSEIVVLNNNVSVLGNKNVIDETEKSLCLAWFNETLSAEDTNGKISTYREQLADKITDEAIKVLGDKWEESSIRTYLNALRHHIAGEEFKQEWNNGLLSSVAAVVVAGDNWEKLLAFMQGKEMTDYSLAFAFYGELNGYANLLRDFTDLLYNHEGKYVREVYKEFYGQLYDKTLLVNKIEQNGVIQQRQGTQTKTESHIEQNKENIASPIHKSDTTDGQSVNENNQTTLDSSEDTSKKWETKLKSLSWWNYNGTKRDNILDLLTKYGPSEQFINKVAKVSGVGLQRISALRSVLEIDKSGELSNTKEPSLFSPQEAYPIGDYFYCDKNVWWHLEPLIDNQTAKREIKKDLNWFQNDIFSKPKGQRGYSSYDNIDEKDNKKVIEKFCNLKRGKNAKGEEQAPYFTENLRECIRKKLMYWYNLK